MPRPRVLIQAGHIAPREPGFESGTGTGGEQEFTLMMQAALAALFRADGRFHVDTCPGDIPDGWTGDVFLSLHIDGAGSEASRGFSFGWPEGNGRSAGHAPRLAYRIAAKFVALGHPGGHHADNYTAALRGYYGWSRVNAPTKLLIEHGFGTNKADRAFMWKNVAKLARATYEATCAHVGYVLHLASPKFFAPWTAYVSGKKIASGLMTDPRFVAKVAAALKAAGARAPWVASVNGKVIARGRFWPVGAFTATVRRYLAQGIPVEINNQLTLKKG